MIKLIVNCLHSITAFYAGDSAIFFFYWAFKCEREFQKVNIHTYVDFSIVRKVKSVENWLHIVKKKKQFWQNIYTFNDLNDCQH